MHVASLFPASIKVRRIITLTDSLTIACILDTKRVEDLIHVAELCIEILQQNDEHYAEVSHGIASASISLLVLHLCASGATSSAANAASAPLAAVLLLDSPLIFHYFLSTCFPLLTATTHFLYTLPC